MQPVADSRMLRGTARGARRDSDHPQAYANAQQRPAIALRPLTPGNLARLQTANRKGFDDRLESRREESVPAFPDQALALRRRRLRHPVGALVDPRQHAGGALRPGARLRAAPRARRDVEIRITAYDETNTRIRPAAASSEQIRDARRPRTGGLVGVQTNQFPRAVDIARPLRAAGIPVCIGGFHVSGCIAMLPDSRPSSARRWISASRCSPAKPKAGWTSLLRAAYRDELQPLYNYMNDLPGLEGAPVPYLPARRRSPHQRHAHELRRRARLPVPLQLLHDHQCPGAQVALAQRRRRRAARARQSRAGRAQLLHHRRQPRPQPELGSRSSTG